MTAPLVVHAASPPDVVLAGYEDAICSLYRVIVNLRVGTDEYREAYELMDTLKERAREVAAEHPSVEVPAFLAGVLRVEE